MPPVILLFAKAPVPGRVKTRLAAGIGPQQAAELHKLFVHTMLARLPKFAECELHLDILTDDFNTPNVSLALQSPGDLGQRMLHALTPRLPALLLGSDSPTVPDAHIQAMLSTTADVTLAPTEDGGYWAIAAHRTHPDMFANVRWSTADTLTDTETACQAAGLSTARGPAWFDIDEPEDLAKITEFLEQSRFPKHPPFMSLTVGSNAPDLNLTDEAGQPFKLSSLQGKTVVLYFYPKADTPGCTTESCEFRDHSAAFAAKHAVIIGISPDVANDQLKFKSKLDLPFSLLADFDHAGAEAYGVWRELSRPGKTFMGIARTTFVIGADGKITHIFEKVQPAGHAAEVLAVL